MKKSMKKKFYITFIQYIIIIKLRRRNVEEEEDHDDENEMETKNELEKKNQKKREYLLGYLCTPIHNNNYHYMDGY